jgi:hypothetical protein
MVWLRESTSLRSGQRMLDLLLLLESISRTDLNLGLLFSVRSDVSRNPPTSSSESSPSRDSSVRSVLSSSKTSDSRAPLSSHSKRLLRLTSLVSLKTPTSVPCTRRELPSCLRTCSSLEESEARDH